jgi:hypothetical protein
MLKKILSILVIVILAISSVSSVCAISGTQYREAPWHWQYPLGNEWDIKYERHGALVNSADISEIGNPSHNIEDVEKGGKKIDASYVGKSILIHTHWYGTPADSNVIVPYYPGGVIWLANCFDSAAYSESWVDVTINNWCNWQCSRNKNGALDIWQLPDDFRFQ